MAGTFSSPQHDATTTMCHPGDGVFRDYLHSNNTGGMLSFALTGHAGRQLGCNEDVSGVFSKCSDELAPWELIYLQTVWTSRRRSNRACRLRARGYKPAAVGKIGTTYNFCC
ncbi:hypothetical protein ATANTOWER_023259 [Ataeniobius toweri]|uniref:Uncharacterized protein n=1 Tax=Ataeniobius toweri TaxID=208326 RepID=A0ABU7BK96_9TELE|nr:hypothetical protein [Ataeniobius toweri]